MRDPDLISMIYKAERACKSCRDRKQGCDKTLPQCLRCSSRAVPCDYTASRDEPRLSLFEKGDEVTIEALLVRRDSCGFELSPVGERQLLWAACNFEQYGDGNRRFDHQPSLPRLIGAIFKAGGTHLLEMVDDYFTYGHPLLSILSQEDIVAKIDVLQSHPETCSDAFALLVLCMHIFIQQPCQHPNHAINGGVYHTARRLFSLLQVSPCEPHINLLQSGVLLAAYEYGHGMATHAHTTLTMSVRLAQQIGALYGEEYSGNGQNYDRNDDRKVALDMCWFGILLLDRTIALSNPEKLVPLMVSSEQVPASARRWEDADDYGFDRQQLGSKFRNRAHSALLVGKELQAASQGSVLERAAAEKALHSLINQHVFVSQDESYPRCEAAAMALSALVSVRFSNSFHEDFSHNPAARLTLLHTRNMILEMCKNNEDSIRKQPKWDPRRLCFLGLCCIYVAAVRLAGLEMEDFESKDLELLKTSLKLFSSRWQIGNVLLHSLEKIIELRSQHSKGAKS